MESSWSCLWNRQAANGVYSCMRPKRLLRIPLAIVAGLIVFLDLVVMIRLYLNGYPTYLDSAFIVHRIPFTGTDWLILLAIISLQAGLFVLVRWSWKRSGQNPTFR